MWSILMLKTDALHYLDSASEMKLKSRALENNWVSRISDSSDDAKEHKLVKDAAFRCLLNL